jgi:hypothetical protein
VRKRQARHGKKRNKLAFTRRVSPCGRLFSASKTMLPVTTPRTPNEDVGFVFFSSFFPSGVRTCMHTYVLVPWNVLWGGGSPSARPEGILGSRSSVLDPRAQLFGGG